jgi:predicted transcriptional regulator
MMTSQLSQPRVSISARDMGKNGAVPNRAAQYLR